MSTVRIIGGMLGGSTINNAASETTLKELLAAVERIEGLLESNNSNGTTGGPTGGAASANATMAATMAAGPLAGALAALTKTANILRSVLAPVAQTLGSMWAGLSKTVSLLMNGNSNLSAYVNGLAEAASGLPLLGKYIGGAISAIGSFIQTFESWNQTLKSLSETGAGFNNSIIEMRIAASQSMLSLDSFASLIRSNTQDLVSLGGTVTEGALAFSRIAATLYGPDGVAPSLINMGMTVEEVSEGLIKFLGTTLKGSKFNESNIKNIGEIYGNYAKDLDAVAKLTGKNKKAIEDQMKAASDDLVYRMKMSKLSDTERAKMESGLAQYTAMYGEAGAKMYKEMVLYGGVASRETALLATVVPGLMNEMQKSQDLARDINVSQEEFRNKNRRIVAEQLADLARNADNMEDALAALAAATGGAGSELYKTLSPIIKDLMQQGKLSEITADLLERNMKKAEAEQGKTQALTKLIDTFKLTIQELINSFIVEFLPVVNEIAVSLQAGNLAGKFRELGHTVVLWVKEFAPVVQNFIKEFAPKVMNFFKDLTSERGQDIILERLTLMFDYVVVGIREWLGKTWWGNAAGGLTEQEAAAERASLFARQKKLDRDIEALRQEQATQTPTAAGTPVPADMKRYLQATALTESGGDTQAKAKTSSASGMFQFTEGTWKQTVEEMGKKYSLNDRFDLQKSLEVMQYFTQKQKAQLEKGTGKPASSTDLYMAHFLGVGSKDEPGAIAFLNEMEKNPNKSAASMFPKAAKSNEKIFYDNGRERSLAEVYQLMNKKMINAETALDKGTWENKPIPAEVLSIGRAAGKLTPADIPVPATPPATPPAPVPATPTPAVTSNLKGVSKEVADWAFAVHIGHKSGKDIPENIRDQVNQLIANPPLSWDEEKKKFNESNIPKRVKINRWKGALVGAGTGLVAGAGVGALAGSPTGVGAIPGAIAGGAAGAISGMVRGASTGYKEEIGAGVEAPEFREQQKLEPPEPPPQYPSSNAQWTKYRKDLAEYNKKIAELTKPETEVKQNPVVEAKPTPVEADSSMEQKIALLDKDTYRKFQEFKALRTKELAAEIAKKEGRTAPTRADQSAAFKQARQEAYQKFKKEIGEISDKKVTTEAEVKKETVAPTPTTPATTTPTPTPTTPATTTPTPAETLRDATKPMPVVITNWPTSRVGANTPEVLGMYENPLTKGLSSALGVKQLTQIVPVKKETEEKKTTITEPISDTIQTTNITGAKDISAIVERLEQLNKTMAQMLDHHRDSDNKQLRALKGSSGNLYA